MRRFRHRLRFGLDRQVRQQPDGRHPGINQHRMLLRQMIGIELLVALFERALQVIEPVRRAEVELNGRGRVILRPSGTEPLVRVTLEGADSSQVEELARQLADTVREELGA